MADTNHSPSPTDSLIADFSLSIKRLAHTVTRLREKPPTTIEGVVKEIIAVYVELKDNVYPSAIAITEQVAEVDEVIQEVVDQQDSYLQPELASQIFATIGIAGELSEEVKKIAATLDDLTKKKLLTLVRAFEHSAQITVVQVSEAISEPGDEEDDEPEVEVEDGDQNDDFGDDEETPVEIPTPRNEQE